MSNKAKAHRLPRSELRRLAAALGIANARFRPARCLRRLIGQARNGV